MVWEMNELMQITLNFFATPINYIALILVVNSLAKFNILFRTCNWLKIQRSSMVESAEKCYLIKTRAFVRFPRFLHTRVEVLDLCFDFLDRKSVCFDRLDQFTVCF